MNCAYGVRRRTLPSVALGCGKLSSLSYFSNSFTTQLRSYVSYVITQLRFDVNGLLANYFFFVDLERSPVVNQLRARHIRSRIRRAPHSAGQMDWTSILSFFASLLVSQTGVIRLTRHA